MKQLRELGFIKTKPGSSGEFHYVLLMNPNAGVQWMRRQGQIQDGVYGRFVARLGEIGAYGELEAVDEIWNAQIAAASAQAVAQTQTPVQAQATLAVPLPPVPLPPVPLPPVPLPPVPPPPPPAST